MITHLSEQLAAHKQDDKAFLYFYNRKLMQKFRNIATELFPLQETCDNLAEKDPNLFFFRYSHGFGVGST